MPSAFNRVLLSTMLLAFSAAVAAQKATAPTASATPARELVAGMDITIAADGSVTRVVPAATLPEPIRQLLIKRVSQWRYEVPMWQGKPARLSSYLILRLLAVPTTAGGFVLRVSGVGGEWHIGSGFGPKPPQYPQAAMRQEIGGTFSYALRLGQDGSVESVRRLYPEAVLDSIRKSIDAAAQTTLLSSRFRPVRVDGAAVACEIALPIVFTPASKSPDGYMEKIPDSARQPLITPCPKLALLTKIENTML